MTFPAPPPPPRATDENLDLLGILYWVYGGIIALGGVALGAIALIPTVILATVPKAKGGPPPALIGGILLAVFGVIGLILIAKAALMVWTGMSLRARRNHVLCMIGAALAIMNFPLGTALAVYTFTTLNKAEVKQRFGV